MSSAVRLLLANKDLWDQYDRLNAEAELRLSLAVPVAIIGAGACWKIAWWAGALVIVGAIALYRSGHARATAANGVVIQCIVADVFVEPDLDSLIMPPSAHLRRDENGKPVRVKQIVV